MSEWITPVLWIGGIGAFCGALLALAAHYLSVPENPLVEQVTDALPGANCGGCGFAGCADFAKAVVNDNVDPSRCSVCAAGALKAIAALLGKDVVTSGRKVALVLCNGTNTHASRRFAYNGITDCAAAAATAGGDKSCSYGCLGYGSCARVCPTDAIEIKDGLARVNPEFCISCGKCVAVCPRKLIKLVPEEAQIHILCSSKDKGPAVKKVCSVGCIGCTICAKLSPGSIKMDGFLAVVDYDIPPTNEIVIEKCPAKTIHKIDGHRKNA